MDGAGGLIDPEEFVVKSTDIVVASISSAATELRRVGSGLADAMGQVCQEWDRLGEHYVAPSAGELLELMAPVRVESRETARVFTSVAAKLDDFAEDLAILKPRFADIEERARTFRNQVKNGVQVNSLDQEGFFGYLDVADRAEQWAIKAAGGADPFVRTVPWYEDGPTVRKNQELLEDYAHLLEQISQAATDTANAISRVYDPDRRLPEPAGSFTDVKAPSYQAYTADVIMAAASQPWGAPVGEKRNGLEQVSDAFGDLVNGIGGLVGFNTKNWFSWNTFGQSWSGLGKLAGSITILSFTSAGQLLLPADSPVAKWCLESNKVWMRFGGGLIGFDTDAALSGGDGWHEWKDEPWRAGTNIVLNLAAFAVPGGEAGAGAKALSTAGRVVEKVGDAGGLVGRFGRTALAGGMRLVRAEKEVGGTALRQLDQFPTLASTLGRGIRKGTHPSEAIGDAVKNAEQQFRAGHPRPSGTIGQHQPSPLYPKNKPHLPGITKAKHAPTPAETHQLAETGGIATTIKKLTTNPFGTIKDSAEHGRSAPKQGNPAPKDAASVAGGNEPRRNSGHDVRGGTDGTGRPGKVGVPTRLGPRGTVWDNMVPTQELIKGTGIPGSFELDLGGGKAIWVHPNAAKHIAEYSLSKSGPYQGLYEQAYLSALRAAATKAVVSGSVKPGQMVVVDGWELIFGPPSSGRFPQLYHAVARGGF